jgi:hypothetical protein
MKQAFAVLAVLLFAVALHAQAPAVPPVTHFIVSGNAVGFNGAGGTSAASLDTAGIQVTANFSAGYEYLGIPAAGEHWEMGAVNYTRTASALLGQRITDAVFFNLKNINVSFVGRLGKLFQPKPTGNQFAEGAGVHISYRSRTTYRFRCWA